MKRHAIGATLTTTGRLSTAFVPGAAEALTGAERWLEVHRRFRRSHNAWMAPWLTVAAWRHGVVLSGSPTPPRRDAK